MFSSLGGLFIKKNEEIGIHFKGLSEFKLFENHAK